MSSNVRSGTFARPTRNMALKLRRRWQSRGRCAKRRGTIEGDPARWIHDPETGRRTQGAKCPAMGHFASQNRAHGLLLVSYVTDNFEWSLVRIVLTHSHVHDIDIGSKYQATPAARQPQGQAP